MIHKVNKIGLIEELSKWKKESQQGNLSDKSINSLKSNNIIKPDNVLADGINRGTDNILAKHSPNTKIIDAGVSKTGKYGGAAFIPSTNEILINKNPSMVARTISPLHKAFKKVTPLTTAMLTRHEAYEAKELAKQLKQSRFGNIRAKGDFGIEIKNIYGQPVRIPSGNHLSGNVLNNEAKMVNDLSYTDDAKNLKNTRQKSGEVEMLKNIGVDYNNTTSKNLSQNEKKIEDYELNNNNWSLKRKASLGQKAGQLILPSAIGYSAYDALSSENVNPESVNPENVNPENVIKPITQLN